MTINVYPSHLDGEPIEVHAFEGGTFDDWLKSKRIDRTGKDQQPIAVTVNGRVLSDAEWATVRLSSDDQVDVRFVQYGDPITWAIAAAVVLAANFLFMPKPRVPGRSDTPQGAKLDMTTASANQVKYGDVVPELAGRHKRFPDYLTPPRRYFLNLREQWLEFLACVGPGEYAIDPADVKVGDTPFSGLGADGAYGIYPPGADLSPLSEAQHWHTVSEVGGTSNGTAGLELSVDMQTTVNDPAPSYQFSGVTISNPHSAGAFPTGWGPGTVVNITPVRPLEYTVADVSAINRFYGDFAHIMGLANDMDVVVSGAGLDGTYIIQSLSVDSLGQGSFQLWTKEIPPTDDDPGTPSEPVDWIAPGDYSITFKRTLQLTLAGAAEDFISVSGHAYLAFECPADIEYAGGNAYGAWTSLFGATPGAEKTTEFEVDVFFPSGLAQILDNGGLATRSVSIEIQYRDRDVGGAFTSVMKSYSQATLDQIGVTEKIMVSAMRPEVRVRRVSATSTSTQIQDKVQWYGLKSRLPIRTSYPRWTTMSVKLRSGGRLGAQSENQINLIATRKLPTLQEDGSWGPAVATRDISAFARYIAHSIGYTDSNLDMDELARLHDVWSGRGETADYVFEETTVKEALGVAFGAGMAEFTLNDGLIKPVRDGLRTQFEQGYSPQNMIGALKRSFRARSIDEHDGVEVEYIDGTTWTKETIKCLLPGDEGFKLRKVKIDGVTDKTRAWRTGMRIRRAMRYRRWEYSFKTELDALNSGYLSYCPLIDDIPGYGKSAILQGISAVEGGALLRVSEPFAWEAGQTHVVAYRATDGKVIGPFVATPGPDQYSLIAAIPAPWPQVTLSHEPPHVYFGVATRWTFPALITEIHPQGNLESVDVKAVNYDERVYLSDDSFPPA